jgi:arsenite-transporting ATPase
VIASLRAEAPAPVRLVPRLRSEPRGPAGLRALGSEISRADRGLSIAERARRRARATPRAGAERARAVTFHAPPTLRIVMFGGKGGVGKTTCASAAAIAIAEQHPERRVLLLSTDPAHSLGDALDVELGDRAVPIRDVRGHLDAREIDAGAELTRRREQYARAVDRLFDALRGESRLDATYDRAIVHDLIELAPPGIDEIVATVALLDAVDPDVLATPQAHAGETAYDHVVVDTAPWGHTERWLELPAHAREWVRSLLAVLLEYRRVIGLGDLAEDLLVLSRGLGRLVSTWQDASRTQFVPVTRAAALPRLETVRMLRSLARMGIAVPSLVVDALHEPGARFCADCARERTAEAREIAALRRDLGPSAPRLLAAPLRAVPPRGVAALREWASTWEALS